MYTPPAHPSLGSTKKNVRSKKSFSYLSNSLFMVPPFRCYVDKSSQLVFFPQSTHPFFLKGTWGLRGWCGNARSPALRWFHPNPPQDWLFFPVSVFLTTLRKNSVCLLSKCHHMCATRLCRRDNIRGRFDCTNYFRWNLLRFSFRPPWTANSLRDLEPPSD